MRSVRRDRAYMRLVLLLLHVWLPGAGERLRFFLSVELRGGVAHPRALCAMCRL